MELETLYLFIQNSAHWSLLDVCSVAIVVVAVGYYCLFDWWGVVGQVDFGWICFVPFVGQTVAHDHVIAPHDLHLDLSPSLDLVPMVTVTILLNYPTIVHCGHFAIAIVHLVAIFRLRTIFLPVGSLFVGPFHHVTVQVSCELSRRHLPLSAVHKHVQLFSCIVLQWPYVVWLLPKWRTKETLRQLYNCTSTGLVSKVVLGLFIGSKSSIKVRQKKPNCTLEQLLLSSVVRP